MITSAPSCERMCAAKGAASMVPSSITRRLVRGGGCMVRDSFRGMTLKNALYIILAQTVEAGEEACD